jgi:hypothetical protein
MTGAETAGMGKGITYPKQDINKTIDYLRSYGMGCGWNNSKDLPDELPTFYLDDENGQDEANNNEAPKNVLTHTPPPPPHPLPGLVMPEHLKTMVR